MAVDLSLSMIVEPVVLESAMLVGGALLMESAQVFDVNLFFSRLCHGAERNWRWRVDDLDVLRLHLFIDGGTLEIER